VDGPDEVRLCGGAAGSTSVRCRHTHRVRPCTPTALPQGTLWSVRNLRVYRWGLSSGAAGGPVATRR
jgi:hypothetical protein